MDYKKEQILNLYTEEKNKTYVAQNYCKLNGLEYSDSIRRSISKIINSSGVVDEDLENEVKSDSINYSNDKEKPQKGFTAIAEDGSLMNIAQYCAHYGLDVNKIRSYKLISHSGIPFYNVVFYTAEEEAVSNISEHLDEIISKYIQPIKSEVIKSQHFSEEWFDRLVFSDVHIAMDVNGNGDPLYDGKWDKEELFRRLDCMIQHTKTYQKSNLLVISNLGDYMDGLGGETTRKGHELPQNMNDKEAFDLGIEFSLKLIDSLVDEYDEIKYNFLVEDNHSGVFSYFVSQAVKGILEVRYPNRVSVKTQKKFIDHFKIGKHTIVETHGKDSVSLKFGFRPHLDDKQAKKIDHYLKENGLYDGNFIEFSKGDSHLSLLDESTSTDFHYYNYPAFSPPSNWVKSNFSNTKSGFKFFNIKKNENIKNHFPFWF
jgi:hypothetical protein